MSYVGHYALRSRNQVIKSPMTSSPVKICRLKSSRLHQPSWARVLFAIGVVATATTGCGSATETIWNMEVRSPDGLWTANALTERTSGPGNAYTATSVYLKGQSVAGVGQPVLTYPQNVLPWINGSVPLVMTWLTPSHLHVTFNQVPTFDTQAIRYAGIDISVGKNAVTVP
jgi:hypothetical protein